MKTQRPRTEGALGLGRRSLPYLALLGVVLSGSATAQVTRSSNPADAYGYTLLDQTDPGCTYDFVDVSATGTQVAFTAAGDPAAGDPAAGDPAAGDPAAEDDGGAVIALEDAFELYGSPVASVVMSTNGYLAMAANLGEDDGGDFSNDPLLPAIPGEEDLSSTGDEPRSAARLLVYHDDLDGAGGTAYHQHFPSCPRTAHGGLDEACTVFQWDGWGFANSADVLSFQAILYHSSHAVAFQVGAGDSTEGTGATLGIQDARCEFGLQHRAPVAAETALCFFEPRFPASGPAADLAVEISNGVVEAVPATRTTSTIVVSHAEGPSPVFGATVNDSFPDTLTNCSWTCSPSEGAACTAAGSGDIADSITLAIDAQVTYTVTCTLAASLTDPVSNTASVTLPAGFTDPVGANNSATDTDQVSTSVLFVDGFESGGTSNWTLSRP